MSTFTACTRISVRARTCKCTVIHCACPIVKARYVWTWRFWNRKIWSIGIYSIDIILNHKLKSTQNNEKLLVNMKKDKIQTCFYINETTSSCLFLQKIINMYTDDTRYVLFVRVTIRSFPHAWLKTWFVTRLTRRLPLVE